MVAGIASAKAAMPWVFSVFDIVVIGRAPLVWRAGFAAGPENRARVLISDEYYLVYSALIG